MPEMENSTGRDVVSLHRGEVQQIVIAALFSIAFIEKPAGAPFPIRVY